MLFFCKIRKKQIERHKNNNLTRKDVSFICYKVKLQPTFKALLAYIDIGENSEWIKRIIAFLRT